MGVDNGVEGATVRKGWSWVIGKTREEELMACERGVTGGFEGNVVVVGPPIACIRERGIEVTLFPQ